MHKQFKQRQNRLEIARIYSELMRLDKINKINRNHMYRDFNYNRKKYLNKANISSEMSRHYYNIDNVVLTPVDMPHGSYRFMSNDQHLLDLLDDAYAKLYMAGKITPLQEKWFYPEHQESETLRWVWYLTAMAGLLLLIAILYILSNWIQNRRITVASNNNAWGTVSGGGTYNEGSTITLTATPASGYRFVTWNDGNTQNPRTVTVTGNATYIATFEAIPPTQYTITVASNNNAWGTVSGGTYNAGAIATLTPIPAAGYRFVCWQDGNTENPRVFTVTGDAAFIATFESTVGIDAVEAAAVTIAPNPATECAVVNGLKAGADVVVVDINGKIRLGATAECDRMALDVSDLSAGVYFVRVSDGTATAVRKLIVK